MSTTESLPAGAPRATVVVMGVSGCGKSTVGSGIAVALGLGYIDGDDLHDPRSVAKMRSGVPLDDDDRWPWLDRIGARLMARDEFPVGVVIACSALRRVYRDRIRRAAPGVRFVYLSGDPGVIRERMASRSGHYMPVGLLDSQLRVLESPGSEELDVIELDLGSPIETLVQDAVDALQRTSKPKGRESSG